MENDNVIMLLDEEGNEVEYEHLETIQFEDNTYVALIPCDEENNDEDEATYVILKVILDENAEELLITIDDDDEYDMVANEFEEILAEDFDFDE